MARRSLFRQRALTVELPLPVSILGRAAGARPRTASFRQTAAEPPRLLPFRDGAVADPQRFVQRQAGADRLRVRRRLLDLGCGHVRPRRAPSHQLDIDRLALLREQEVQVEPGGVRMRRALENAGSPRLARHAFLRPDPANRNGRRGVADALEMEVRHLDRAGVFAGRDLLRHAGMAALERRFVPAQLLDEFPAETLVVHDCEEPVVSGPRDFEIVDRKLVPPIRLGEVPPALWNVGLVKPYWR